MNIYFIIDFVILVIIIIISKLYFTSHNKYNFDILL